MNRNLELGIVGLGKIGGNLARQALEKGLRVAAFDPGGAPKDLLDSGLTDLRSSGGFREALSPPRVVFLYVPAGPIVDQVLDDLVGVLEEGDVIVDGGNSYWGDSIRRSERLAQRGFRFVDLGTSGGIDGARSGACFMAGGERAAFERVEPILARLALEGGLVHAGPPGAGHFVKLVHNGIEFGMLQAIGEGMHLLERFRKGIDVPNVLRAWGRGSVVRSWLIELMETAYREEGGTGTIPPYVEDTGEVNWLVADALEMEVPLPVISQSVLQLLTSRDEERSSARAVAMMRHGFGGHPYGPDEGIRKARPESRVGPIVRSPKAGEWPPSSKTTR